MKKRIKLTEDILRRIIRENLEEIGKTPWRDGFENEYNRDHVTFGRHEDPYFESTFEFDDALDADTPEEYDKRMADREEFQRMRGELAQNHHPQATPYRSIDSDDVRSFDTRKYPLGHIDEAVRKSIKKVLGKK